MACSNRQTSQMRAVGDMRFEWLCVDVVVYVYRRIYFVFLKIFELCFGYALLGKGFVLLLAQMYKEYYNIVQDGNTYTNTFFFEAKKKGIQKRNKRIGGIRLRRLICF